MWGHLKDCHRIIKSSHINLFCLIEIKLILDSSANMLLHKKLQLSSMEASINNFECALGGRILLKWNLDLISFQLLEKGLQFIHDHLTYSTYSFFLTYNTNNEVHGHIHIWNSLWVLATFIYSPWLLMGDFNNILSSKDKVGGAPFSLNKIVDF